MLNLPVTLRHKHESRFRYLHLLEVSPAFRRDRISVLGHWIEFVTVAKVLPLNAPEAERCRLEPYFSWRVQEANVN